MSVAGNRGGSVESAEGQPLRGMDDLLAPFFEACKPRSHWRIGIEAEKFGVHADTGRPLQFHGATGVADILRELTERHAWFEEREHELGEVIALRRGDAAITLEPGAQLELSGAPHASIHQVCAEFRAHMAELREVSDSRGVVWLGLGFHPFARQQDLPWVPKLRYGIMSGYLPTRGAKALDMMRRTCTVQANLDYESEADAVRKLRVALAVQPIVAAMFANSPFVEGRETSNLCERALVWLHVDPDRTGILPFAWEDDFSFQGYVEWALDVPMFLIKRGGEAIANTGQTFRSFLADGYAGQRATRADWAAHLSALFPEVRLRRTLELRGADAQSTSLVCAVPAVWKGLLYEEQALRKTEKLVAPLSAELVERARPALAEKALRARLGGKLVLEWAAELMEIALDGLRKLSNLDRSGEDETIHLARICGLLSKGQTPAEALVSQLRVGTDLRELLLQEGIRPRIWAGTEPWLPEADTGGGLCHGSDGELQADTGLDAQPV